MNVQEVVYKIELAGIDLVSIDGNINIKSNNPLTHKQRMFLLNNKKEIIRFLEYRQSTKSHNIECPDSTVKQALLYEWVCRKYSLNAMDWNSFDKKVQLNIAMETNEYYSALENQCDQCINNTNTSESKYGCLQFNLVHGFAIESEPDLIDWKSCPLFRQNS